MFLNTISIITCTEKADPFDKEKQTIEALLSQWDEEDVPESELTFSKPREDVPCFNSTVIEETNQIFQPVTAVQVNVAGLQTDAEAVIIELGCQNQVTGLPQSVTELPQSVTTLPQSVVASPLPLTTLPQPVATHDVVMTEPDGHVQSHGELPKSGQFLPVEGGYILVEENAVTGETSFIICSCYLIMFSD